MAEREVIEQNRIEREVKESNARGRENRKKRNLKLTIICSILTVLVLLGTGFFAKNCISDKKDLRDQGIEAFNSGNYEEAIKLFQDSINQQQWFSEKMDADTDLYLAASYIRIGEYISAGDIYKKYLYAGDGKTSIGSADLDTLNNLAQALEYTRSGDVNESSIANIKSEYDRGNKSMAIYLGACYQQMGDYDNMVKYFNEYADEYGMNTYISMQLSSYYIDKDDLETAITIINKGLSAGDDLYKDRVMYNSIVLSEKKLDYETALEKATDLVEEYPNNETYQKEYDFLYSRINVNADPVYKKKDDQE